MHLIFLWDAVIASDELYASYRKDFFYPYDVYREVNLPDPVNGGRFHIVGVAAAGGNVGNVYLNGKQVQLVSGNWDIDWLKVYDNPLVKGKSFWISFHTRCWLCSKFVLSSL